MQARSSSNQTFTDPQSKKRETHVPKVSETRHSSLIIRMNSMKRGLLINGLGRVAPWATVYLLSVTLSHYSTNQVQPIGL